MAEREERRVGVHAEASRGGARRTKHQRDERPAPPGPSESIGLALAGNRGTLDRGFAKARVSRSRPRRVVLGAPLGDVAALARPAGTASTQTRA